MQILGCRGVWEMYLGDVLPWYWRWREKGREELLVLQAAAHPL